MLNLIVLTFFNTYFSIFVASNIVASYTRELEMECSRNIQQEKALKTLRKIVNDKKIVLESIRKGVSAVELKKKGINIASPL